MSEDKTPINDISKEVSRFKSNNPKLTTVASLLFLLAILSPSKDVLAWLTLVLGPLLVIDGLYISQFTNNLFITSQKRKFLVLGAILPLLGMYFSRFGALFSISGIPFGYYILIAILVVVQLILTIDEMKSLD